MNQTDMTKADFYLFDLKTKFLKIDPSKYYIAYSGGKDSGMLFWFLREWLKVNDAEMYERYKQIPAVAVNTYLEWPEISRRMLDNADVVLTPKMKPHEVIAKVGTPCFNKSQDETIRRYQNGNRSTATMNLVNRSHGADRSIFSLNDTARNMLFADMLPKISPYCCMHLKKMPFKEWEKKNGNKKPIMGIMGSESIRRKAKYTSCFTKSGKFTPLWDCTEEVMNEIYAQYSIPLPSIYQHINQTGCAGCPYGIGLHHTEIELALMSEPKRRYVEKLFGDAYRIRGVGIKRNGQTTIDTPFSVYDEVAR